jgi:glycosyltransferase involved in cell wall biosynthesis
MGHAEGLGSDSVSVLSQAGLARSILRNAHRDPVVQGDPRVSVILATYNWSSVLRQAVRSVLWQTYPHLELIVVGDGCTDDSQAVVESFGDRRVRWHNLDANTGSQAIPNNTALSMAKGEWIAYQGHDDVWHPKHLATMLAHLQRSGADLGYSLAEVLGPPGSRVRFLTGLAPGSGLAPGTWLPPTSMVHRADLSEQAGGWRTWEEGDGPPDTDFVTRLLEAGARPVRVPAITTFKFPASFRKKVYRERPSHEQEAYVRRIQSERLFAERELAALTARRLSPLKGRLEREELTDAELRDAKTQYAWLRRVRGLD